MELMEKKLMKSQYLKKMINNPSIIEWTLYHSDLDYPYCVFEEIRNWIEKLIEIFDAKKIIFKCCGKKCNNRAIVATFHAGDTTGNYWCSDCLVKIQDDNDPKTRIINTYKDALAYLKYFNIYSGYYKDMILELAFSKGLRSMTERNICLFFNIGEYQLKNLFEDKGLKEWIENIYI